MDFSRKLTNQTSVVDVVCPGNVIPFSCNTKVQGCIRTCFSQFSVGDVIAKQKPNYSMLLFFLFQAPCFSFIIPVTKNCSSIPLFTKQKRLEASKKVGISHTILVFLFFFLWCCNLLVRLFSSDLQYKRIRCGVKFAFEYFSFLSAVNILFPFVCYCFHLQHRSSAPLPKEKVAKSASLMCTSSPYKRPWKTTSKKLVSFLFYHLLFSFSVGTISEKVSCFKQC